MPEDIFHGIREAESIYSNMLTWIILASVLGVGLKFLPLFLWYRGMRQNLGPFLGLPQKSSEQVEADRRHSYRVWGSALSIFCFAGGVILLLLGVRESEHVGFKIAGLVSVENATPGTVLLILGFLVWRQTHK